MKRTFFTEFWRAFKQTPRLYFAPIIWAFRGPGIEWRRIERENARRDAEELAEEKAQEMAQKIRQQQH